MGELGVDQIGGRFRLDQTLGVKSIDDGRIVAFSTPVRVQIREAELDGVVVEQQGPVENDLFTTRVRNIAGLNFELLDLVGNGIALLVLAPVPTTTAKAGVFEILEGKSRPVGRPRPDAAALASQEGANLLTARNRTTGGHHLIEVAVGIGAEALLVVGGKIVRLSEDFKIPSAAAGAQLL